MLKDVNVTPDVRLGPTTGHAAQWDAACDTIWSAVGRPHTQALAALEEGFAVVEDLTRPDTPPEIMVRALGTQVCREVVESYVFGRPVTPDTVDRQYDDFRAALGVALERGGDSLEAYGDRARMEVHALWTGALLARQRNPNWHPFPALWPIADRSRPGPNAAVAHQSSRGRPTIMPVMVSGRNSSVDELLEEGVMAHSSASLLILNAYTAEPFELTEFGHIAHPGRQRVVAEHIIMQCIAADRPDQPQSPFTQAHNKLLGTLSARWSKKLEGVYPQWEVASGIIDQWDSIVDDLRWSLASPGTRKDCKGATQTFDRLQSLVDSGSLPSLVYLQARSLLIFRDVFERAVARKPETTETLTKLYRNIQDFFADLDQALGPNMEGYPETHWKVLNAVIAAALLSRQGDPDCTPFPSLHPGVLNGQHGAALWLVQSGEYVPLQITPNGIERSSNEGRCVKGVSLTHWLRLCASRMGEDMDLDPAFLGQGHSKPISIPVIQAIIADDIEERGFRTRGCFLTHAAARFVAALEPVELAPEHLKIDTFVG